MEMHVGWIMDSREHRPSARTDSISEENEQFECGSQAESLGSRCSIQPSYSCGNPSIYVKSLIRIYLLAFI